MIDAERRRFESLEDLRRAEYDKFNDRRNYEWKLSLSIWTTLAVSIAGLVQPVENVKVFPIEGTWAVIVGGIVAFSFVVLHAYWSYCAERANSINKDVEFLCTKEMEKMSGIVLPDETKSKIEAAQGRRIWSHLAQVLITAVLATAVCLIIYKRVG